MPLSATLQSSFIPYENTYARKYNSNWYHKTKCIVCGEIIFSSTKKVRNFSRVAHQHCSSRYWERPK